jgi:hypothetical protein
VIGVNVNGYDARKLKEVMGKEKLTWRSFADDGYVIDHRGMIRHKWVGSPSDYKLGGLPEAKAIDSALEKLIKVAEADQKKAPK